jgi:hypothetical protein
MQFQASLPSAAKPSGTAAPGKLVELRTAFGFVGTANAASSSAKSELPSVGKRNRENCDPSSSPHFKIYLEV